MPRDPIQPPPHAVRGDGFFLFLPSDLLHDILLRLPAKTLCRLRAVCRSWRSLTTDDPLLLRAHASRHPHVVSVFHRPQDGASYADITDLSGNMVRRIDCGADSYISGLRINGDLLCLVEDRRTFVLPGPHAGSGFILGQVASAGQYDYKLLRMRESYIKAMAVRRTACEVFTIDRVGHRFRKKNQTQSPPAEADATGSILYRPRAVVKSIVYFLVDEAENDGGIRKDSIASFDLDTEEWTRALLLGPQGGRLPKWERTNRIKLAELSECLVVVHANSGTECTDLWFLLDSEEGNWSKKYSISVNMIFRPPYPSVMYDFYKYDVRPLFVSDGDRIVLQTYQQREDLSKMVVENVLWVYDTSTNTATEEMRIGNHGGVIEICKRSFLSPWMILDNRTKPQ